MTRDHAIEDPVVLCILKAGVVLLGLVAGR